MVVAAAGAPTAATAAKVTKQMIACLSELLLKKCYTRCNYRKITKKV